MGAPFYLLGRAGLATGRGTLQQASSLIPEHQCHPYRRRVDAFARSRSSLAGDQSGGVIFVLLPADWSWRRHSQQHATASLRIGHSEALGAPVA